MKSRKDEYFSPHLRRHTRHKSAFPQLWWHKPDQILSLDSCMAETSLPDPNKKMSADLMVRSDNELLSYLALALAKGFAIGLWRASEYSLLISQKLWSLPCLLVVELGFYCPVLPEICLCVLTSSSNHPIIWPQPFFQPLWFPVPQHIYLPAGFFHFSIWAQLSLKMQ